MMDIQIKRINNADLLLRYLRKADSTFPIPLSDKTDLMELAKKLCEKGVVFSAAKDGEMWGVIGMYANDRKTRRAYVSVLSVLPEYSGRGIASVILQEAVEYAEGEGMKEVFLYTHRTNEAAIRLYKKKGFRRNTDPERPGDILFTLELDK